MLSLAEALAALPDTADGIAAHLRAKGIRGVRENPDCCPIANYLSGTGGLYGPDVDPSRIDAFTDEGDAEQVCTPAHIAEFVRRFDDGEWPELVLDDAADDADQTNTQEQTA